MRTMTTHWWRAIAMAVLFASLPGTVRSETLVAEVASARSIIGYDGEPKINLTLTEAFIRPLEQFTERHLGKFIAVRFNGRTRMRARLMTSLSGGSMQVSGAFDAGEAERIARELVAGTVEIETVTPDRSEAPPGGKEADTVSRPSVAGAAEPLPQLIYMTRKGLDPENNRIDRLISIYGFLCLDKHPTVCRRIERELVSLLAQFPQTRTDIARELSALGASCEMADGAPQCRYERQVENAAWITGERAPRRVIDEFFRIDLRARGEDGALQLEATFNRTSRPRD